MRQNTTRRFALAAALALAIGGVHAHDGKAHTGGIASAANNAVTVDFDIVHTKITTEKNIADFSRRHQLNLKPVVYDTFEAAFKGFFSGRCQVYSTDASGLASVRNKEAPKPDDYLILPELISKEALGPMIRRGDDEWLAIVRWTVYALLEAEELGLTQANIDKRKAEADPAIQRFVGTGEDMGKLLGLDKEWALRAVKAVGNYGEIFERNVGQGSPLKLQRGMNKLWNQGGLMYPPPFR